MPRRFRPMYSSKRVARRAKKRTGAKSQSKQIQALSRQVSKIAEISSVPLQLRWQRQNSFVDREALTAANSGNLTVYMCPIPVAPSQVGANVANFADTGPLAIGANDFKKTKVWITATDVNQKPRCTHRGGYLTYKLSRPNISLRYIKVMLIKSKSSVADQMSLQRSLQYFDANSAPPLIAGQSARLIENYDYIHNPVTTINDPVTGVQINPQMWEVLAQRTHKFGTEKPFIPTQAQPISPNAIGQSMRTEATGFFKIPAGGAVHKIWSTDHTQQATNLDYVNQRSEKNVFLVIFSQRGSTITDPSVQVIADVPANELKLSLQVRDTYSCSEGSLTPQAGGTSKRGRGRPRKVRTYM